jgi:integrase/recombinase XerD
MVLAASVKISVSALATIAGVDINTIRAWLGHVSVEITNVYAEIDFETRPEPWRNARLPPPARARLHWRDQPALMDFLGSL